MHYTGIDVAPILHREIKKSHPSPLENLNETKIDSFPRNDKFEIRKLYIYTRTVNIFLDI